MKINCLIIDDEPSSQTILKKYIEDVEFLNLTGICNNAIEALQKLKNNNAIDLLLLDINMPKISGLTFYKSLQNPPEVIFTTAYPQYAVDGFEVNAIDYLLKPFSFERFFTAISKVLEKKSETQHVNKPEFILIKSNKVLHKIAVNTIEYVEAFGDYVKVHLNDSFILTNSTFASILMKLQPYKIVRTHKSFAVNLEKINSTSGNQIFTKTHTIPIGQKYKSEFLKFLNQNH